VVIVIGLALAAAVVWWIRWGEPSHAVGYYERGVRHFDAGRYDAAIDDSNSSLRLGTSSGAYSYLGRCRHAREEYELAIQELTFALQLDGSFTPDLILRGDCQYVLGRYAEARSDFERAVSRAPQDPWGYNALAWMLARCPDDNFRDGTRAISLATRACELTDWEDAYPLDTLAAAYAETGRYDEAIRWQQNAIRLAPIEERELFEEALELYERGEPYRDIVPPQQPATEQQTR